jgi:hypothetical protein
MPITKGKTLNFRRGPPQLINMNLGLHNTTNVLWFRMQSFNKITLRRKERKQAKVEEVQLEHELHELLSPLVHTKHALSFLSLSRGWWAITMTCSLGYLWEKKKGSFIMLINLCSFIAWVGPCFESIRKVCIDEIMDLLVLMFLD